ncbi:MAG: hypothetical protein AAF153_00650, partial [Pseudomonadota bacterium]
MQRDINNRPTDGIQQNYVMVDRHDILPVVQQEIRPRRNSTNVMWQRIYNWLGYISSAAAGSVITLGAMHTANPLTITGNNNNQVSVAANLLQAVFNSVLNSNQTLTYVTVFNFGLVCLGLGVRFSGHNFGQNQIVIKMQLNPPNLLPGNGVNMQGGCQLPLNLASWLSTTNNNPFSGQGRITSEWSMFQLSFTQVSIAANSESLRSPLAFDIKVLRSVIFKILGPLSQARGIITSLRNQATPSLQNIIEVIVNRLKAISKRTKLMQSEANLFLERLEQSMLDLIVIQTKCTLARYEINAIEQNSPTAIASVQYLSPQHAIFVQAFDQLAQVYHYTTLAVAMASLGHENFSFNPNQPPRMHGSGLSNDVQGQVLQAQGILYNILWQQLSQIAAKSPDAKLLKSSAGARIELAVDIFELDCLQQHNVDSMFSNALLNVEVALVLVRSLSHHEPGASSLIKNIGQNLMSVINNYLLPLLISCSTYRRQGMFNHLRVDNLILDDEPTVVGTNTEIASTAASDFLELPTPSNTSDTDKILAWYQAYCQLAQSQQLNSNTSQNLLQQMEAQPSLLGGQLLNDASKLIEPNEDELATINETSIHISNNFEPWLTGLDECAGKIFELHETIPHEFKQQIMHSLHLWDVFIKKIKSLASSSPATMKKLVDALSAYHAYRNFWITLLVKVNQYAGLDDVANSFTAIWQKTQNVGDDLINIIISKAIDPGRIDLDVANLC